MDVFVLGHEGSISRTRLAALPARSVEAQLDQHGDRRRARAVVLLGPRGDTFQHAGRNPNRHRRVMPGSRSAHFLFVYRKC